jgi:hypothetical protein
VKSPAYVLASLKALMCGVRTSPEDDHGALLKAAEEAMMEDGSPNNNSLMPFELTGQQKYSVIHQDIISQTSWDTLQALPAPIAACMRCRHYLSACSLRANRIVILQEFMQFTKSLLSFIVKMGSDSTCLSDVARI